MFGWKFLWLVWTMLHMTDLPSHSGLYRTKALCVVNVMREGRTQGSV